MSLSGGAEHGRRSRPAQLGSTGTQQDGLGAGRTTGVGRLARQRDGKRVTVGGISGFLSSEARAWHHLGYSRVRQELGQRGGKRLSLDHCRPILLPHVLSVLAPSTQRPVGLKPNRIKQAESIAWWKLGLFRSTPWARRHVDLSNRCDISASGAILVTLWRAVDACDRAGPQHPAAGL